ncbi:RNA polymerase sigma factor (sigma-70 family) [Allocatelliglobosispora scoriae]|uniref:RNA polymerase sigma factor (Sigma-70 family) n=1 Tax=Allocatelliglobosispora scoriae TaxID=643052 RepID=A0A841BKS0_9ACTN|nr:sigma-70 family RNA polymerase sigma factor [Allocatelliglobosispora scoriae]MBB5867958.1 RNA polymerase sigma factor (sigma-70 family) [Allocatelliglobosispora scoriae]
MAPASETSLVTAAQAGDRQAMETLFAEHLPLVYNVIGRVLNGHSDVDDVVQETMLRAVAALPRLRDPERFRSWLIAIAIRQTQDRGRARGAVLGRQLPLDDWPDPPHPGPGPAEETIVAVDLSAQRREAVLAAQWLSAADQRLLALWWQETGGVITRSELAASLGLSTGHAAVRVQRMKAQLDLARRVLRARRATPLCPDLQAIGRGSRHGAPSLVRLGRHLRDCRACQQVTELMVPAEQLLTGGVLLPVPAVLAAKVAGLLGSGTAGLHAGPGLLPAAVDGLRRLLGRLTTKTAVVGGSTLASATAAVVLAVQYLPVTAPEAAAAPPSPTHSVTAGPSPAPAPTTAPATPSPSTRTSFTGVAAADIYVAPDGRDDDPGTLTAPLATLGRAVALVRPGQTIALRGGTYRPTAPVAITTSGEPSRRITMSNYRGEKPVIDASLIRSNQWFITQRASYWTVQGLTVQGSPTFPYVCVGCRSTVFQRLTMFDNGATGLVLRGPGTIANQVLDSDFHDNHDDAAHGANADGVAFKDGSGTGNLIRGCRAFRNADDGVDLSGFADPVRIEHTWAHGNGVNRWGLSDFAGAGTGFKLGGGDPTPAVAHVVTDNAAWDNASYGFTEQNNKGVIVVTGNTAYRNGGDGFAFWFSPSVLRANLAQGNGRDDNRGDTVQEFGNSWNQADWNPALLRATDQRTAEGARRADGRLPRTAFLTSGRSGTGATMTP